MPLKKGDNCFRASIYGKKIEVDEYILRTIQRRKGSHSWEKPTEWAYWWQKIPGFGFLKTANPLWRVKRPLSDGRPYSASKVGALRDLAAETRFLIKDYGEDYDFDQEGVTLGKQLKLIIAAQKRSKRKQK